MIRRDQSRLGRPADALPPGELIQEELEARGWSALDLAEVLGRPPERVESVLRGEEPITPRHAVELTAAFGTPPELWLNLETAHRLAHTAPADPDITERAYETEAARG